MNPGINIGLHYWRGIGPSVEPDLFFWEWRFGILTLTVERNWPLERYRKLRGTIRDALRTSEGFEEEEGR